MNPAKPLLYLTVRSLVNGVKRALMTPRRLLTLIFVVGYYFLVFVLPSISRSGRAGREVPTDVRLDFPPLEMIDVFAFGLFSALSLILLLGVMGYQGGFKPADVDILFPTPIPPKVVLLFRIIRDYLVTLIMPFFILILGLRPAKMGWEAIFRDMPNPEYSGMAFKAMTASWLLMSMGWVTIGYAVSLYVSRSDTKSDRNRRLMTWAIIAFVLLVSGYLLMGFRNAEDLADVRELANSPLLRLAFLNATFATKLTLASFYGSLPMALLGAGGLIGIVAFGLVAAMAQSGWMYDQAAVKGFKSTRARQMQQAGDFMGMAAERARDKKVKVKQGTRFHRLRWQGPLALLWKELFLQPRSMWGMLVFMGLLSLGLSALPAVVAPSERDGMGAGALYLLMQASILFMITLGLAQTGYLELLKRVDLQKPLPFTPATTVFYEILAKSLLGTALCWIGSLLTLALGPSLLPYVLAGLVMAPFASVLLSAVICFFTILFPDLDDASQRQFRGLLSMVGIIIVGFFPTSAFLLLSALAHAPLVVAAVAASVVSLALTLFIAWGSGAMYASFNPSE